MKKTLATIAWLFLATAAWGNDGQHTGVGGSPSIPPENTGHSMVPGVFHRLLNTGLQLLDPMAESQDTSHAEDASQSSDPQANKTAKSSAE